MTIELQSATLAPLVAQALNKADLEILEWHVTPLGGQGGTVLGITEGVFRVSGSAQDRAGIHPWSLILKGLQGTDAFDARNPGSWNYWKREALAYQSGLLDDLPGSVSAPRCYAVQEPADERTWLWLEDVQESINSWTMADYGLAARHFGQFNGAYLAGYPLPQEKLWMSRGRVRPWNALVRSWLPQLEQIARPSALHRILPDDVRARVRQLAECESLLQAFERLPATFCHLDAFRRNLFLCRTQTGTPETMAIDWAYVGFGRVGEEAGVALAVPLAFADVPISQAPELDQVIFTSYLDGLHDAGWHSETRMVRLGFVVTALVLLMFGCVRMTAYQPTPEAVALVRSLTKRSFGEMIEDRAQTVPFILDLGDEARSLAAAM